jgi:hypothetical protein
MLKITNEKYLELKLKIKMQFMKGRRKYKILEVFAAVPF